MKWPLSIAVIRHAQSAYNALRERKKNDPEYVEFVRRFDAHESPASLADAALKLQSRFAIGASDYDTPLTEAGFRQAQITGSRLLEHCPEPDVIFVSPYKRTRETLRGIVAGGGLDRIAHKRVIDDRIREQEHGLSLLYNDWRIFQTIHPDQRALYKLQGPYWYQYPQGESVSMVRERIRSFMAMLTREFAGAHVWVVSHHLTLLSIRANLERLSPEEFVRIDSEEKPINCGVTIYEGRPELGKNGRLILKEYNKNIWA